LVRLVIDEQSEGHGVTPNDLSTKPGQPQSKPPIDRDPLKAPIVLSESGQQIHSTEGSAL